MSYLYTKSYKDLREKEDKLEEEIKNLLIDQPDGESLVKKFEEYNEIKQSIVDLIESDLQDLEWEHDDEISDKDSEIDRLESEIDDLESKIEKSGIIGEKTTLEDEMKVELFAAAAKKFTLTQLEEKLGGNKFELS